MWNNRPENQQAQQIITNIPYSNNDEHDNYLFYLYYYLENLETIVGYYQPTKWRRRVWKMRISRQKALANMVRLITGRTRLNRKDEILQNTIVAFGCGNFSTVSPGFSPTPKTSLFRTLGK